MSESETMRFFDKVLGLNLCLLLLYGTVSPEDDGGFGFGDAQAYTTEFWGTTSDFWKYAVPKRKN